MPQQYTREDIERGIAYLENYRIPWLLSKMKYNDAQICRRNLEHLKKLLNE